MWKWLTSVVDIVCFVAIVVGVALRSPWLAWVVGGLLGLGLSSLQAVRRRPAKREAK